MEILKTTNGEYHDEKENFLNHEISNMTMNYIRCKSQMVPEDREGFTPPLNAVVTTSKVSVPI